MKIINPNELRNAYADLGWLTLMEISEGIAQHGERVSYSTISNALNRKPIRPSSVRAMAAPLNKKVTEIAEFVES